MRSSGSSRLRGWHGLVGQINDTYQVFRPAALWQAHERSPAVSASPNRVALVPGQAAASIPRSAIRAAQNPSGFADRQFVRQRHGREIEIAVPAALPATAFEQLAGASQVA